MKLRILCVFLFVGYFHSVHPAVVSDEQPNGNATVAAKSLQEVVKDLENLMGSITKMVMPYFVRNSDLKISPSCMSTFIKLFVDLRKMKLPAIKLVDASAKPPFGLMRGQFGIMGDYDECLGVRATKRGDPPLTRAEEFYHGQYCTVVIDFPPALTTAMKEFAQGRGNISDFGKMGPIVEEMPAMNFVGEYFKFHVGVCMPSTCTAHDLEQMLEIVPLQMPMSVLRCEDGTEKVWHYDQMIFLAVVAIIIVFVVLGTALDGWLHLKESASEDQTKSKIAHLLLAFSLYSNSVKLMKNEKGPSDISVINGMYVLGTFLVVVYHTYFLPFFLLFTNSATNFGNYLKDVEFTMLVNMDIGIEAYFIFSGLLLVYPRFRRNQASVQVNVLKIIVRRYIRLCPSLLLVLGIIVLLTLIGSGPVWTDIFDKAAINTRKWWWTYALMFNNFLDVKNQNFLYLWFIPCLMQITIIGAVYLWILAKFQKLGIFLIMASGLACNIALGVLTAIRHYPPSYGIYYFHNREYFEETIYTSPLSHVFSYGIGMLLGLYMAKNKTSNWSRGQVVIGWVVSLLLTVGTQLLLYPGHKGQDPDPVLAALYAATHRTAFSVGLCWVILACTHGYGGALQKFLGWKGFGPLSKLGYFGYLMHYIVIAFHVSMARMPLVYSHYENWMRIFGYTVVTFLIAYILYITFELPLTYIESLFFTRRTQAPDIPKVSQNGKPDASDDSALKMSWNGRLTLTHEDNQSKL